MFDKFSFVFMYFVFEFVLIDCLPAVRLPIESGLLTLIQSAQWPVSLPVDPGIRIPPFLSNWMFNYPLVPGFG